MNPSDRSIRGPAATAVLLGIVHAVVDGATVATVYTEVGLARASHDELCRAIVTYNVLAFGLQPAIGLLCDRFELHRPALFAGLASALLGVAAGENHPAPALVLAGLGNAVFHVAAGALVLAGSRGCATTPGIFVAPGAFGLLLGVRVGQACFPCRWLVAAALALSMAALAIHRTEPLPVARAPTVQPWTGRAGLVAGVALLLVAVAIRSAVGDVVSGRWRDQPAIVAAITAAAVAGKALGGLVADRIGWRAVAVAALVVLAPLATPALTSAPLAVAGVLLSQMTMAVTLSGTYSALPAWPGTAFGLASLALLIGAVPGLTRLFARHDPAPLLGPLVALAAVAIVVGLGLVLRRPGATSWARLRKPAP